MNLKYSRDFVLYRRIVMLPVVFLLTGYLDIQLNGPSLTSALLFNDIFPLYLNTSVLIKFNGSQMLTQNGWPSHELESCIRNSPTSQLVFFFFSLSVNMKEPKDENFQYLTRRLFTTAFQCGHRACILISSPTSPCNRSATSKSQQTGRHVSHVSSIA